MALTMIAKEAEFGKRLRNRFDDELQILTDFSIFILLLSILTQGRDKQAPALGERFSSDNFRHDVRRAIVAGQHLVGFGVADEPLGLGVELELAA